MSQPTTDPSTPSTPTEPPTPSTPQEFMDDLAEQLRVGPSRTEGLDAVFGFAVEGEGGGSWWVEARDGTGAVHAGPSDEAVLTVRVSGEVLLRMARGELDGGEAFAVGLLSIEGDQSKAMFLGQIFGH
jgi:putative sterol carrier protein